jgi:hypothetical protein
MAAANAILILAFALGPSPVLAFVDILFFVIGFNFGYGSLVWVYASESFPRQRGASSSRSASTGTTAAAGRKKPDK